MKITIVVLVLALCGSLPAAAQIELPGCGCGVSSSTVSCSCPAGFNKDGSTNKQTVCDGSREIVADSITLSPGALLTRWVPGEDDLIVGQEEGTLANEAKSHDLPIDVIAGLVLFMPKDGPYELRNVGKQALHIIVIRMRTTTPASK
jgi:hypothetical protein